MVVLKHMLMGLLMVSAYAATSVWCILHVGAAYALLAFPMNIRSTACKQVSVPFSTEECHFHF